MTRYKIIVGALLTLLISSVVFAEEKIPKPLIDVGITERLGESLPLDLQFTNAAGNKVLLKDVIDHGKPTLINFVYFNCPMLCHLLLNGFADGLQQLDADYLKRINIITISMDPKDTPDHARDFKTKYLDQVAGDRLSPEALNWSFLVAQQDQFTVLANAIGFNYKYDPESGDYAHAAATYFLTPRGVISRYLYGIMYPATDLKLAILEASEEKTVSTVEKVLLFCYNYDPDAKGFVLQAWKIMQVGGILTVLFIIGLFISLRKYDKKELK